MAPASAPKIHIWILMHFHEFSSYCCQVIGYFDRQYTHFAKLYSPVENILGANFPWSLCGIGMAKWRMCPWDIGIMGPLCLCVIEKYKALFMSGWSIQRLNLHACQMFCADSQRLSILMPAFNPLTLSFWVLFPFHMFRFLILIFSFLTICFFILILLSHSPLWPFLLSILICWRKS